MVKRAVTRANEDTHTLSDVKGSVYKQFQVKKHGFTRGFKMGLKILRKDSIYYPYVDIKMAFKDYEGGNSSRYQLPADFLIDENGIIVDLFRAKTSDGHMEFQRIEAFIPKDKTCKCNKKDCISPTCRENYEQIRQDSEAMLCSW